MQQLVCCNAIVILVQLSAFVGSNCNKWLGLPREGGRDRQVARVKDVMEGENKGKRPLGKARYRWENDTIKKRKGIKWNIWKWLKLFWNSDIWSLL